MPTIRILSDRVANQIAAGEVIERPAAVVKELVENSLDAGATRIEVEFRHGGRSYIRVEDNGSGMTKDDALLSLERHATSKLLETADLGRLDTFGFRGEAVPSIASVSHFELQTRPATGPGTEIVINGGKLVHVRECGLAPGTRTTVTHLFNSVPARRKFLKTDATESAHIIQTVRLYALACPATAFTLVEDGRVLFQSPVCSTLAERVAEIFGRQLAGDLLPVEMTESGLKLSGLIGKPGVSRATRHEMLLFVNRRPVDSRTLNYALIESYATSLAKGRYPVAVLFLNLDPAAVDVNVHPAKREVRFRSEGAVRGFVIRAVLQTLREFNAPAPAEPADHLPGDPQRPALAPIPVPSVMSQPFRPFTRAPFTVEIHPQPAAPVPAAPANPPPLARAPLPASSLMGWRFLGTAHGDYALFEAPGGVVVLDRRAAHERVWFERLQAEFAQGEVASQRLLFALPVELDAIASALLTDRLKFLHAHGLEVAEFGRNFFRIEAVPAWLEPADAETFLRDVLGLMREGRLDEKKADLANEELARLAAQKAVRLPVAVSEAEALTLVARLFACTQPHTSPVGRPTHFELSKGELGRRFQR
ncbi:DNA mismatch repair endonuclease MutL [Opitutus sp. GAS368]|jgi:DNA mismatch repair protein MutL|uniref:DNA mismatch repair endonuclease MutL n=1 Tax=Opitutus sp. GAS368 TaxID=1882749 RepID=UPI00087B678C|nr:DNA mismatch repair endonuclease MutL [Opitutus sp. GAS368]SDR66280.1 DNA mismatch repair protein MutL [Opitutus sp. GAS368]